MKIHYISDHAILEYDEVQMFLDLGHEVFSNGAYLDPAGHITLARPGLKGAKFYENWAKLARETSRTEMPAELIDPFDVIIIMHSPNVLIENWERMKHKRVIWRSIGQSVPGIERRLAPLRAEGLEVVRYSPKEEGIADFMGSDAMIRFYKDPEVYKGWDGFGGKAVNFSQSLKGRREFCHYDEIIEVIETFAGRVYGPGNEDLGSYNGGQVTYEQQIEIMQKAGVFVYGGTYPASYTLSFIEALMTGLPIVAISKTLAHIPQFEAIDFYEVDELLARIGGVVCDSADQMIYESQRLLNDQEHAENISRKQRELAIELFGKDKIYKMWEVLLNGQTTKKRAGEV